MRSISTILLLIGLTGLSAEDPYPLRVATMLGGDGIDKVTGIAIDSDGIAFIAVASGGTPAPPPGVPVHAIDGAERGSVVIRYDTTIHEVLSASMIGFGVHELGMDDQDRVYLLGDGRMGRLNKRGTALDWSLRIYGSYLSVGKDGRTAVLSGRADVGVTTVTADGKTIANWTVPGTKSTSVCFDADRDLIYVGGFNTQSNLWWPWLKAYSPDGTYKWSMWDYSKGDAWAAGTADSSVREITVFEDQLLIGGYSDGNPTAFEKNPLDARDPLPKEVLQPNMWKRADPATSRTVGWFGIADPLQQRMLASRRVYSLIEVPRDDWMKKVCGSNRVRGLAGYGDTIAVAGWSSGLMQVSPTSPHQSVGPVTIKGRWGNIEAPEEPYLAIISSDAKEMKWLGTFGQGESDRYRGQFHHVAVGNGVVVAGGWVEKPLRALPDGTIEEPGSLIHLQNAWQSEWGTDAGDTGDLTDMVKTRHQFQIEFMVANSRYAKERRDAYIVVLGGGGPNTPIEQRLAAKLREALPEEQSDLAQQLAESEVFAPALAALDPEAAAVVTGFIAEIGDGLLTRARALEGTDPAAALESYQVIAKRWAGLDAGATASDRLSALDDDKVFQDRLDAMEDLAKIQAKVDKLRSVDDAAEATMLDLAYLKANGRALERIGKDARRLIKDDPEGPAAQKAKALLARFALPADKEAEKAYGTWKVAATARARLRPPKKKKALPNMANKEWVEENRSVLPAYRRALETLLKRYPDTAFAARAQVWFDEHGFK